MSNFLRAPLRTLFTAIGGALPTANPLHRGMFAWKKATSTEDELYAGVLDASSVMQWRRLVTTTYADSTYVNTSGDTMTGALTITKSANPAFRIEQDGGTDVVRVNSTLQFFYLINGTDLLIYSDDGTTQKASIDGATGDVRTSGQLYLGAGDVEIVNVTGSPEGVTSAPDGSIAMRDDGAANTNLYVKQTGAGNTGWVPANLGLTFTLGPFFAYNTAISTTVQMQILEPTASGTQATATRDFEMKNAGRVVGGILNANDARTAGTATLAVRVNGTPTNLTAVLNATDTQFTSAFVNHPDGVSFAAGDSVGAAIVTDGSWAPTTADFNAYLIVSLDPFI